MIAVTDAAGSVVARYIYDAWGNHAVLNAGGEDITDPAHIGNVNPIRYRGYYYDGETDLYYLQTRYYDPTTGRFVTIDGIEYADPETLNGLNLYAYCGNNPVMNVDPDGTFFWFFFIAIAISVAVGFGSSVISQGIEYGWNNINFFQAALDGLLAGVSTALSMTGIGLLGAVAVNAVFSVAQYSYGAAFHGEEITWQGLLSSAGIGALTGLLGGRGASNGKVIAESLSGKAASGMKALITSINRYGAGSNAVRNVQNLYGKVILNATRDIVKKAFIKGFIKSLGITVAQLFIELIIGSLL